MGRPVPGSPSSGGVKPLQLKDCPAERGCCARALYAAEQLVQVVNTLLLQCHGVLLSTVLLPGRQGNLNSPIKIKPSNVSTDNAPRSSREPSKNIEHRSNPRR